MLQFLKRCVMALAIVTGSFFFIEQQAQAQVTLVDLGVDVAGTATAIGTGLGTIIAGTMTIFGALYVVRLGLMWVRRVVK